MNIMPNVLISVGAIIAIVVVVLIVLFIVFTIGWAISIYNKLITARNRMETQWSQIEVQLKRRFDLIPNLVETVKGYTKHENDVFMNFADARKMYAEASKNNSVSDVAKADASLSKALNIMVNAVTENYPDLKADAQYNSLMADINSTEDKIATQRQFYNDVVYAYNNLRERFPSSIIANWKGFKKGELFDADDEQVKDAPKISF